MLDQMKLGSRRQHVEFEGSPLLIPIKKPSPKFLPT
jgi:hypothetical protein